MNSNRIVPCLPMIAALASFVFVSPAAAQKLEKVVVATSVETIDALVPQFGTQEGIFAKHGIELGFIKGANGPAMISAVAGNSADVTHVGAALIFPAIEKGATMTVLSGNYDIDYTFIARKNMNLDPAKPYTEEVKKLQGKRVGVAGRGGATEVMLRRILSQAGMNADKDVTMIAIGTGIGSAGAFINDQVDAMISIPPSDILIGAANFDRVINLQTTQTKVFDPNYLFTIFTGSSDFVNSRPKVAENFCKAVRETMDFIQTKESEPKLVAYLAKTMNLKPEQAAEILATYKKNFNMKLTRERWDSMKNYTPFVPDWSKHTFEPCVKIAS